MVKKKRIIHSIPTGEKHVHSVNCPYGPRVFEYGGKTHCMHMAKAVELDKTNRKKLFQHVD